MRWMIAISFSLASSCIGASSIRIMPLGDSITYGYPAPGGYRTRLYSLLASEGYSFDFVGSLTDNGSPDLPDPNHEGHPGWRAIDLSANIAGWLNVSDPDVILLHIGTNDLSTGASSATTLDRLNTLMGQIISQKPGVRLIVSSVVPRTDKTEFDSRSYNSGIPTLVSNFDSQGYNVSFVDIHAALTSGDLYDGIHPNQGGYDKMANAWNGAIQSAVPVPEPVSVAATGTGLGLLMLRRRARKN